MFAPRATSTESSAGDRDVRAGPDLSIVTADHEYSADGPSPFAPERDSCFTVGTSVPSPQPVTVTTTEVPDVTDAANEQFSAVPELRKSVAAMPTTDSEKATVNTSDDAFVTLSLELSPVSDAALRLTEVTDGTVRSTVTDGEPVAVVATLPAMSATPNDPDAVMLLAALVPVATEDCAENEQELEPVATAPMPEMFVNAKSDCATVAQFSDSPADSANESERDRVGLAVEVEIVMVGAVRSIVTVGAETVSFVLVLSAAPCTAPADRVRITVPALQPVTDTSTGAESPDGVAVHPVAVPENAKSPEARPVMAAEKLTSYTSVMDLVIKSDDDIPVSEIDCNAIDAATPDDDVTGTDTALLVPPSPSEIVTDSVRVRAVASTASRTARSTDCATVGVTAVLEKVTV